MTNMNARKPLSITKLSCILLLTTVGLLSSHVVAQTRAEAGFPMVNPNLDDPEKPWCYFTHPVTVIGMPWQPDPIGIQVTPEGNIFTGYAEFCLFFGEKNKPLTSRQRQFVEGYIPVVTDSWTEGAINYNYEVFSTNLTDFEAKNTLQLAKITLTNKTDKNQSTLFSAAFRQNGEFRREGNGGFNPNWQYAIENNQLFRGKSKSNLSLIGSYPKPTRWEAVNGQAYTGPFAGKKLSVSPRTEVAIARYELNLKPDESRSFIFKFPRKPTTDPKYLKSMNDADYNTCRATVIKYWKDALTHNSRIHTPGEPKIEQVHRATAAHVLLATRTYQGKRRQTDGLPYPYLFLTATFDYAQLYESFGMPDFLTENFKLFKERQQPDGLFVDTALSHGQKIFCGHGQPLYAMANRVVMSRDIELGKSLFSAIKNGVECIISDSNTQPHGLMRASIPYDNEMIKGQYTCHNYWALIALRPAINTARLIGETETADKWLKFYDKYEKQVVKAVRESAHADGYVPTGLYDFITGNKARSGFAEYRTDQDWENVMLLWPTELIEPGDRLVTGTLERLRKTKYREGIMTYRNGQHLHQYITTRVSNQYLANGQPREALIDLYHAILHSGSASESFENMIRPWTDRDVEFCPPPHAWGCSNISNTIRNLFVMERGGRGGIDLEKRDLHLLNAISPKWFVNGKALGIEDAPTSFGLVSAMLTPNAGGAEVSIKSNFHTKPHQIVVRIPYFVELISFSSDAKVAVRDHDFIRMSPDATKLSFKWKINNQADQGLFQKILMRHRQEVGFWDGKREEVPAAPKGFLTTAEINVTNSTLSFQLILKAWKAEYARRFASHVKAGGPIKTYSQVQMQTPKERLNAGVSSGKVTNLAQGKKATSSKSKTSPDLANDGVIDTDNFWQSNEKKAWWQVDLGESKDISTIVVIPQYKDKRGYKFRVKTSLDGKKWTLHVDKHDNKKSFGKHGCEEQFQLTPMRYIRVEMLGNSVNGDNQLIELIAK